MSKYKELLEKIADENLRKELDEEISVLSRDKGEYGRKLMEKDSEMAKLKEQVSESASYKEAFKVLKEKGVDAKAIPGLLDKLKVTKTLEDDLFLATQSLKEYQSEVAELRGFKKSIEIRNAISKVLAEEKANFKDDKGEVIQVVDDFIPEDKLYADIDVSNEVLIRERVKSVLKDGVQKQEAMLKKFGFQGNPTHTIPEAQGGVGQIANASAQLREIAQKNGVAAAMSEYLNLKKQG